MALLLLSGRRIFLRSASRFIMTSPAARPRLETASKQLPAGSSGLSQLRRPGLKIKNPRWPEWLDADGCSIRVTLPQEMAESRAAARFSGQILATAEKANADGAVRGGGPGRCASCCKIANAWSLWSAVSPAEIWRQMLWRQTRPWHQTKLCLARDLIKLAPDRFFDLAR